MEDSGVDPPIAAPLRPTWDAVMQGSNFLVAIALGVVLVILLAGLWNMMRGGSPNRSQNLMRARVVAQFAAIVVAMVTLWLTGR